MFDYGLETFLVIVSIVLDIDEKERKKERKKV